MTIDVNLVDDALKELHKTHEGQNLFRHALAYLTPPEVRILEIGAGPASVFTRENYPGYKALDFYSTEEVKAHFIHDYGIKDIENQGFIQVDFVCKDGLISKATDGHEFDLIYSSHAIEHQPCFLTHLQEIERSLSPDGVVALIVPCQPCTFDALRPLSCTGEVLSKFHAKNKMPSGTNVFEFYARHINLNPGRRVSIADNFSYSFDLQDAYIRYMKTVNAENEYVDIHNWTFIPDSFVLIVLELFMLGLTELMPKMISPIVGNEFMCLLKLDPKPDESEMAQLNEFRLQLNKGLMLNRSAG